MMIVESHTTTQALLSGPIEDIRHLLALAKETLINRLERGDTIVQSMDDLKSIHNLERGLSTL